MFSTCASSANFSMKSSPSLNKTGRTLNGSARLLVTRCEAETDTEKKVAFVAGATGRTGLRAVRELVNQGYSVRAGVRDVEKAKKIFAGEESSTGLNPDGSAEKKGEPINMELLEVVKCDVEDATSLPSAIGDASVVLACIGAPESEALNPALPRRIDADGAINLVNAAKEKDVEHYLMVSSLGTGKFGYPAAVLNLFWGILDHKKTAEDALIASGVPFTIVRPGGMERPTDEYQETHATTLYPEDTQFGSNISRLQIAQLLVAAIENKDASSNKIVEAVAEEGGVLVPLSKQLAELTPVETEYRYTPSAAETWATVMGFGGLAPEAINSRLAMVAALAILVQEFQGKGSVLEISQATWVPALVFSLITVAASLIPFSKRVSAKDANAGPFNAVAELTNGRLAMLAIAVIGYSELSTGLVFSDIVKDMLPF